MRNDHKNRGWDKDMRPKLILGNDRGGTWYELKQRKAKKYREQDKCYCTTLPQS